MAKNGNSMAMAKKSPSNLVGIMPVAEAFESSPLEKREILELARMSENDPFFIICLNCRATH